MPFIDYDALRHLSPQAFKLYTCFLYLAQIHESQTLSISLAELGYQSRLQRRCPYPALRHGKDGQLRRALSELLNSELVEKHGRRGRAPNTYRLLNLSDTQPQT